MSKKWLLVIVVGVALLVFAAFGLWQMSNKKTSEAPVSPLISGKEVTPTQALELKTWKDPAGFTFSYPVEVKIDPHDEDQKNYAHLELTAANQTGKILIWVKDNPYKTLADWAKAVQEKGQVFDTQLGGKPAKKLAYTDGQRLDMAAVDAGALVLIENMDSGQSYWQKAGDQIVSSFAFIPLEGEESEAPGPWEGEGGTSGVVDEGEEVVE